MVQRQQKAKRSSQGGLTIWHGMTVSRMAELFRLRPRLSWSKAHRSATLPGMAVYNSAMAAAERVLYGDRIAAASPHPEPIFVLGHWRSGTTLLHNLLCRDPRFTYANLYQTLFPEHFLLTETVGSTITAPLLPKTRPMDNVACGWDLPQEDEVALCSMSLISPYLMVAFPGRRELFNRYFELDEATDGELARWKGAFLRFVRKLAVRDQRPLVLKSPSHTFRIRLLLELFPDARFVYIHRDPYAVFASSCHLRRAMYEENSLGGYDTDHIEDDVLDVYERCVRTYERDKSLIADGRLHEVAFEDLERDPLGQMEAVYDGLSLPDFATLEREIEILLPELRGYKKNQFELTEEQRRKVREQLAIAFETYGYEDAAVPAHVA